MKYLIGLFLLGSVIGCSYNLKFKVGDCIHMIKEEFDNSLDQKIYEIGKRSYKVAFLYPKNIRHDYYTRSFYTAHSLYEKTECPND